MSKKFKDDLSGGKYWKTKDMEEGEIRFRVVQKPIFGWIDWKDNKPYRFREGNKPKKPFVESKPIKSFVAFYVWDYERKTLFILEFNQKTILMALDKMVVRSLDELVNYDLKLFKIGEGQESRYSIKACPPAPFSDEIRVALADRPANLDALFAGGDPWNFAYSEAQGSSNVGSFDEDAAWNEVLDSKPSMTPLDELREHLLIDDISTDRLEEWLNARAKTKGESVEAVIKACLDKDVLPRFKKTFIKYIAPADDGELAI